MRVKTLTTSLIPLTSGIAFASWVVLEFSTAVKAACWLWAPHYRMHTYISWLFNTVTAVNNHVTEHGQLCWQARVKNRKSIILSKSTKNESVFKNDNEQQLMTEKEAH